MELLLSLAYFFSMHINVLFLLNAMFYYFVYLFLEVSQWAVSWFVWAFYRYRIVIQGQVQQIWAPIGAMKSSSSSWSSEYELSSSELCTIAFLGLPLFRFGGREFTLEILAMWASFCFSYEIVGFEAWYGAINERINDFLVTYLGKNQIMNIYALLCT